MLKMLRERKQKFNLGYHHVKNLTLKYNHCFDGGDMINTR